MTTCVQSNAMFSRAIATLLVGFSAVIISSAQPAAKTAAQPMEIPAIDVHNLDVTGGKAEAVEYQGRKALRLTTQGSAEEVFAFLKGAQIQDGIIEAEMALKTTTPPGVRMPGFIGIAFRARPDASHYDMFYVRPGNSHSEDQA